MALLGAAAAAAFALSASTGCATTTYVRDRPVYVEEAAPPPVQTVYVQQPAYPVYDTVVVHRRPTVIREVHETRVVRDNPVVVTNRGRPVRDSGRDTYVNTRPNPVVVVDDRGGYDHGSRDHGDRDQGDRDHGDRDHGDRDHGDRNHGDRDHGHGDRDDDHGHGHGNNGNHYGNGNGDNGHGNNVVVADARGSRPSNGKKGNGNGRR